MVLVLCEMQSVSYRIWTRVAVSIFYDDNDYTTGTFVGYERLDEYHKVTLIVLRNTMRSDVFLKFTISQMAQ